MSLEPKSRRARLRSLLRAVWWSGTNALLAVALAAQDPTPAPPVMFDLARTSIVAKAATIVAEDLVAFAQGQQLPQPGSAADGAYRELVRLAFELAPGSAPVLQAHGRLIAGQPPEAPQRVVDAGRILHGLLGLARTAAGGRQPDDLRAAAWLFAAGLLIEPTQPAFVAEGAVVRGRRGEDVAWRDALAIYGRAVADQAKRGIQGLYAPGGGGDFGGTMRIIATYHRGDEPLALTFHRPVGDDMEKSAVEASRWWRGAHKAGSLPTGQVEISFEDKFAKVDGPSAAVAFAILMRSFFDPFDVDPHFAVTGDLSTEGKVLQVGGIHAKLRGAIAGGCTRAAIPNACEVQLADAVIQFGPSVVHGIEVYGIETVGEAIDLAHAERGPLFRDASAKFAELQRFVSQRTEGGPTHQAAILRLAREIRQLVPNHLSARLLEKWAVGELDRGLSLTASLERLDRVLSDYLEIVRRGDRPEFGDLQHETDTKGVASAQKALSVLRPKLHPSARVPADRLKDTLEGVRKYAAGAEEIVRRKKETTELDDDIARAKRTIERKRHDGAPIQDINDHVRTHNARVQSKLAAIARYEKAVARRSAEFERVVAMYNDYVKACRVVCQGVAEQGLLRAGR